jgi:diguanylate cyclase (GGDEF)-like protein
MTATTHPDVLPTFPRVVAALLIALGCGSSALAAPPQDELGRCFELRRSEPAAAVTLADSILSRPGLSLESEIKALSCLGMAAGLAGDGARAATVATLIQARIAENPDLSPDFDLRAISNAGAIFHSIGRIHQAEQAYAHVTRIARQAGGEDAGIALAVNLTNIGLIHVDYLDSPEAADGYYRQALAAAATVGYEDPQLLYNHARNLVRLGRGDEADLMLEKAEALAEKRSNVLMRQRVRAERAGLLLSRGDPSAARPLLEEALRVQRTLPDPAGEASSLAKLSALQRAGGQKRQALDTARRAWAIVEDGYQQQEKLEALRATIGAHVALGQSAEAMAAARTLHALKMGALKQQRLELLADLQARSQDAAAQREIERLRHDGQIRELNAASNRLTRNLITAGLALLVLVGLAVGLMQRRRHRRLRAVSAIDPLTGLKNRRTATGELNAMAAQRAIHDTRHVLFLIDIDHFKRINDTLGHHAGDAALVQMSARLKAACRPGDLVARWGGEEFLIACPNLDMHQAERIADRLCREMAHSLDVAGASWPVTVSLGMAPIPFFDELPDGHVAGRWDYALRIADRALYVAKETRNAWVGYWGARASDEATAKAVLAEPEGAAGIVRLGSWTPRDAAAAIAGSEDTGNRHADEARLVHGLAFPSDARTPHASHDVMTS